MNPLKNIRTKRDSEEIRVDRRNYENQKILLQLVAHIAHATMDGHHLNLSMPQQRLVRHVINQFHGYFNLEQPYGDLETLGTFRALMLEVLKEISKPLDATADNADLVKLKEIQSRWENGAETRLLINDLYSVIVRILPRHPK